MWRACERWGIFPPGVFQHWDEIDHWTQARLLGFEHVRQFEEAEEFSVLAQRSIL